MDRDGTLTEEVGYVNHPSRLRVLPRSAEAIRRLNAAGIAAVVVTNQAGIARGYFSAEVLAAVNATLVSQLKDEGAHLDGLYVCPHHPTEGKPVRISREAPVLILRFAERQVFLGGAANASHNAHALGARVTPIGAVGRDGAGEELLALFRAAGISTDGIVTESGRTTPMKTRIMAGGYQATRQQVVRLDREPA